METHDLRRWSRVACQDLFFRVRGLFWNKPRFRELSAWRKAWVHSWMWIMDRWMLWVVPHLIPRTYARKQYHHLSRMRIPSQLDGYLWEETLPSNGKTWFTVQVLERDGPWGSTGPWFGGETVEQAREQAMKFIDRYAERAGMVQGGYALQWHDSEPPKNRSYTR